MAVLYTNFQLVTLSIDDFNSYSGIQASPSDSTTPVQLALLNSGSISFSGRLGLLSASILGAGGDDSITSGDGADTISGGSGSDFLRGLSGNDSLLGGAGNDSLFGAIGKDTLSGGEGIDHLEGGSGDDWYFVDSPDDIVVEAFDEGIDKVYASGSRFKLAANIENLTVVGDRDFRGFGNDIANELRGGGGKDQLYGLGGDDTLFGKAGDTLIGGNGDDVYRVTGGRDPFIIENADGGIDTLFTNVAINSAIAGLENITLTGKENARITGNELDNVLIGNAGGNTFFSGAGNDTLTGGKFNDTFFFFDTTSVDLIRDFEVGIDKIGLHAAYFEDAFGDGGALQADMFKDLSSGPVDSSDRILFDRRSGEIFYDQDGSGVAEAELFCVLRGTVFLQANDLFVSF